MSYLLERSGDIPQQLVDVFIEQIQAARVSLANYPSPDPEGLHSARKNIKRLRSLLRLLGNADTREFRQEINNALRKVGRSLSLHRDREVVDAHLLQWMEETNEVNLRKACGKLRSLIMAGDDQRESDEERNVRVSAIQELEIIAENFKASGLQQTTAAKLGERAHKAEYRLRSAGTDYLEFPNEPRLHEWRKRAKDRMYQQQLLAGISPSVTGMQEAVKELETLLGMARDRDLIEETVLHYQGEELPTRAGRLLIEKAMNEKEHLLQQAGAIWREIYP